MNLIPRGEYDNGFDTNDTIDLPLVLNKNQWFQKYKLLVYFKKQIFNINNMYNMNNNNDNNNNNNNNIIKLNTYIYSSRKKHKYI